jgi:hypothetical protein
MTAGMITRRMEGARVSLPRAGLGALLAATLLAGGLLGAAIYAGIGAVTAGSAAHAVAITVALPPEPATVRDARIAAGNGQLAGDARGLPSGATGPIGVTRTSSFPVGRDGFGFDQAAGSQGNVVVTHSPGRGPLQ